MSLRRASSINGWMRQILSSTLFNALQNDVSVQSSSLTQVPLCKAVFGSAHAIDRWRQRGWLSWSSRREISVESSPVDTSASLPYKLSIVTGDVRGAGSSAPALLTLFGEGLSPYWRAHKEL